jgi:hypothetical protein
MSIIVVFIVLFLEGILLFNLNLCFNIRRNNGK